MLIIGGTGKIGRELVKHFSEKENVIFTYFSNEFLAKKLEKETGTRGIFLDVTQPDDSFLKNIRSNNIKRVIFSSGKLVETSNFDFNYIDNILRVNLVGPIYLAEKFISIGVSKLLFLTDINGIVPYSKYWLNSISSAGILMLIKTLTKRHSPAVIVNGLAINAIDEPFAGYASKLPMKRLPQIEEILKIVDFLMYDNSYITGQIFLMDGGRTLI